MLVVNITASLFSRLRKMMSLHAGQALQFFSCPWSVVTGRLPTASGQTRLLSLHEVAPRAIEAGLVPFGADEDTAVFSCPLRRAAPAQQARIADHLPGTGEALDQHRHGHLIRVPSALCLLAFVPWGRFYHVVPAGEPELRFPVSPNPPKGVGRQVKRGWVGLRKRFSGMDLG